MKSFNVKQTSLLLSSLGIHIPQPKRKALGRQREQEIFHKFTALPSPSFKFLNSIYPSITKGLDLVPYVQDFASRALAARALFTKLQTRVELTEPTRNPLDETPLADYMSYITSTLFLREVFYDKEYSTSPAVQSYIALQESKYPEPSFNPASSGSVDSVIHELLMSKRATYIWLRFHKTLAPILEVYLNHITSNAFIDALLPSGVFAHELVPAAVIPLSLESSDLLGKDRPFQFLESYLTEADDFVSELEEFITRANEALPNTDTLTFRKSVERLTHLADIFTKLRGRYTQLLDTDPEGDEIKAIEAPLPPPSSKGVVRKHIPDTQLPSFALLKQRIEIVVATMRRAAFKIGVNPLSVPEICAARGTFLSVAAVSDSLLWVTPDVYISKSIDPDTDKKLESIQKVLLTHPEYKEVANKLAHVRDTVLASMAQDWESFAQKRKGLSRVEVYGYLNPPSANAAGQLPALPDIKDVYKYPEIQVVRDMEIMEGFVAESDSACRGLRADVAKLEAEISDLGNAIQGLKLQIKDIESTPAYKAGKSETVWEVRDLTSKMSVRQQALVELSDKRLSLVSDEKAERDLLNFRVGQLRFMQELDHKGKFETSVLSDVSEAVRLRKQSGMGKTIAWQSKPKKELVMPASRQTKRYGTALVETAVYKQDLLSSIPDLSPSNPILPDVRFGIEHYISQDWLNRFGVWTGEFEAYKFPTRYLQQAAYDLAQGEYDPNSPYARNLDELQLYSEGSSTKFHPMLRNNLSVLKFVQEWNRDFKQLPYPVTYSEGITGLPSQVKTINEIVNEGVGTILCRYFKRLTSETGVPKHPFLVTEFREPVNHLKAYLDWQSRLSKVGVPDKDLEQYIDSLATNEYVCDEGIAVARLVVRNNCRSNQESSAFKVVRGRYFVCETDKLKVKSYEVLTLKKVKYEFSVYPRPVSNHPITLTSFLQYQGLALTPLVPALKLAGNYIPLDECGDMEAMQASQACLQAIYKTALDSVLVFDLEALTPSFRFYQPQSEYEVSLWNSYPLTDFQSSADKMCFLLSSVLIYLLGKVAKREEGVTYGEGQRSGTQYRKNIIDMIYVASDYEPISISGLERRQEADNPAELSKMFRKDLDERPCMVGPGELNPHLAYLKQLLGRTLAYKWAVGRTLHYSTSAGAPKASDERRELYEFVSYTIQQLSGLSFAVSKYTDDCLRAGVSCQIPRFQQLRHADDPF